MDAGTHTIGKLFGQDRRYVVPLFQRPYVWNEEDQWEPLWDDVRTVAERLIANQATRPHSSARSCWTLCPSRPAMSRRVWSSTANSG